MARKKDEKRVLYQKKRNNESYFNEDTNFVNFADQLASMGLMLRDVPGDGNCLFRALGDQMEGNGHNHKKYRELVVQYMVANRNDFEPFIEDDVSFDKYVKELGHDGTYAGNDAIAAFAKMHKIIIVIHQLNCKPWMIRGTENPNAKQIHISYHNGDHYSSVRKLYDLSKTPTKIKIQVNESEHKSPPSSAKLPSKRHTSRSQQSYSSDYSSASSGCGGVTAGASNYSFKVDENGHCSWKENKRQPIGAEDYPSQSADAKSSSSYVLVDGVTQDILGQEDLLAQHIAHDTGCNDYNLIVTALRENFFNVDRTIQYVIHVMSTQTYSWDTYGLPGQSGVVNGHQYMPTAMGAGAGIWSPSGTGSRIFGGQGTKPKTMTARETKQQKKLEKKQRATERHRQRIVGNNSRQDSGYHENDLISDDEDDKTVIVKSIGALNI